MSDEFNPHSHDSMFARILAQMEADSRAREDFRREVRARFDRGAERMNEIEGKVDAVHEQATKTNGRVTTLEMRWKIICARVVGAVTVITSLWGALLLALEKGWIKVGF